MADKMPTPEKKRIIDFEQVKHTLFTPTHVIGVILFLFTWVALVAGGWYGYYAHRKLEQKVAVALSNQPIPEAVPNIEPLLQRITFLENQMSEISMQIAQNPGQMQTSASTEPSALTNNLLQRLDTLQVQINTLAQGKEGAAGLVAAISLREAVASGNPYTREFATLSMLTKEDVLAQGYLKTLQPFVEKGVATPATLKASFQDSIMRTLKAARQEEGKDGIKGWVKNQLAEAVQVRRVGGDVEGDDVEAVLARAEHAVEQNKFANAHNLLQTIKGKPGEALRPWMEEEEAYHKATTAADNLYRQVLGYTHRDVGIKP